MIEKGGVEVYPDVVIDPERGAIQIPTINDKSLRVLSRTKSAADLEAPGPPPDGGVLAWKQVVAGHLIVLITWYVPILSYPCMLSWHLYNHTDIGPGAS